MLSVPREKYLEMNWRAADKVAAWKVFKRRDGSDLHGRPDSMRRDSGPSYLWQEVMKHTTTGTLLKIQFKDRKVGTSRYGTLSRRASNNQLHFGISETLIWQTSDKTNRRQRLTWISASSRLSGDANGRRKLRRSE